MLELGEFTYLACLQTSMGEAHVVRHATTLWLFTPGKLHLYMCTGFLVLLINSITLQTPQAVRVGITALVEQVCDRMD